MLKIASISLLLHPATLATTLALTTIFSYPLKSWSQTPSDRTVNPQLGCVSGYPNGTYRGDRPVTRYEFAAGLNACLNRVNEIIPNNRANLATKEDLEVLIKRQRELNIQLQELNQRVDTIPNKK
ncbi:S-layer homology domain-containing protein [Calothrix sp. NIES-2098]|uniref:S-layer homology domain-containing protein n=1 Tax=Calothrix sp. NIES-2098 TaxID=1954171 RepID=UPI000B5F393F|nr:S-layer region-like protein [Calothrix sp. NIES-2098]